MRGGTYDSAAAIVERLFQSTRPVRGGTRRPKMATQPPINFNPPAPCGAGRLSCAILLRQINFNPPAPCGAGLKWITQTLLLRRFQSTRPVRGGTIIDAFGASGLGISIHPPRAGRDFILYCMILVIQAFQSTRPVRGGTIRTKYIGHPESISIHPPRAGRDCGSPGEFQNRNRFQSTRPVRGGTTRPTDNTKTPV